MLVDMADVLRLVGQTVEEVPNWKTTSRTDDKSRYKVNCPNHFMHHHTATRTGAHQPHSQCRLEARQLQLAEPNEPTSNLGLCPHAVWFTIAAGPTNTNGLGSDWWHPVGDPKKVPDNSMNSYALANEMMNNGVSEPYPVVMQQALLVGTAALCRAYNIGVFENRAHFEWAPTRKIDPAGPSRWTNNADPNKKWLMGAFRTDLQAEINRQLNTSTEEDDLLMQMFLMRGPSGQQYGTNRHSIAFRVTEQPVNNAEFFRDVYKYAVDPRTTGPIDISAAEEAALIDMIDG